MGDVVIRTVILDAAGHLVRETAPPAIQRCLAQPGHLLWLDLLDPTEEELALVQREFGLHRLAIEDLTRGGQRPKLDCYGDHFYLVCYALQHDVGCTEFEPRPLNVFVGKKFVLTIHAGEIGILSESRARWEKGVNHSEDGAGFLLYFILDAVVDDYFPVLDAIDERVEALEQSLFTSFKEESLKEIFQLKRSLVAMRRVVAPLRDTVHQFVRQEQPLFAPSTIVYFQDVYDHVIRVVEALDTHREMLTGTLEAYLGVLSSQLNQVMKKLTLMATIVGGAGLILGAWGMNITKLPLKDNPAAFPIILTAVCAVALVALGAARRERWF
jgi:magnesium transporter